MATESQAVPPSAASVAERKIELTINTKPDDPAADSAIPKENTKECTCDNKPKPKPKRQASFDSDSSSSSSGSEDEFYDRRRAPRRHVSNRRYVPSPIRIRSPIRPVQIMCGSSTQMLDRISNFDGIADLPFPARSSVYLTTYPFTANDVKKWSWLFAGGVEEKFVTPRSKARRDDDDESGDDSEEGERRGRTVKEVRNRHRDHSPYLHRSLINTVDIPVVYMSRALDTSAIPEDTKHEVRYLIVVQNRGNPQGAKLLVAESRKAAGIMMYYEALKGESVNFVGAVVGQGKKLGKGKMKKVESLDEAVKAQEEGVVGIVC